MVGVFNPNVVENASDLWLGECAVYANYTGTPVLLGATNGGSKLDLTRTIKDVKYDGAYGKTKELKRTEKLDCKITVNFLKITYANLAYGIPITVVDGSDKDGTYKEIQFDLEMTSSDVLDDISLVGKKWDGKDGIIILENALSVDKIEFDFKSKDHLAAQIIYSGFYTYAAPSTAPLKIRDYYA